MKTPSVLNLNTALAAFVSAAQTKIRLLAKTEIKLEIDSGYKFIRIWKVEKGSRTIWAFIDIKNGDIYQAKTWIEPKPGPKGNVYELDAVNNCGINGPGAH